MGHSSRYRHVVLLAAFACNLLCSSQAFVVGVYHVALLHQYHQETARTTWVAAINLALLGVGSPIASSIMNFWDCRTCLVLSGILAVVGHTISAFAPNLWVLIISQGVIVGLGFCLCFQGSMVALALWYRDKTSGVTGLALMGSSLGTFVFARLTQALIDHYGLPGAFLLNGALAFHACALGLLVRPAPVEVERKRQRRHTPGGTTRKLNCLPLLRSAVVNHLSLCRKPSLALLALSSYCAGAAFSMSLVHMAQLYVWRGVSPQTAALAVSVYGLASTAGRVLLGGLANSFVTGKALLLSAVCGLSAVSNFLVPLLTSSHAGMFAHALLLGLYLGSILTMIGPVAMELVQPQYIASAFGVCFLSVGIGSLSLRAFSGISPDLVVKYYIAGILLCVACVASLLSYVLMARDRDKRQRERTAMGESPGSKELQPMMHTCHDSGAADQRSSGQEQLRRNSDRSLHDSFDQTQATK